MEGGLAYLRLTCSFFWPSSGLHCRQVLEMLLLSPQGLSKPQPLAGSSVSSICFLMGSWSTLYGLRKPSKVLVVLSRSTPTVHLSPVGAPPNPMAHRPVAGGSSWTPSSRSSLCLQGSPVCLPPTGHHQPLVL